MSPPRILAFLVYLAVAGAGVARAAGFAAMPSPQEMASAMLTATPLLLALLSGKEIASLAKAAGTGIATTMAARRAPTAPLPFVMTAGDVTIREAR